MDISKQRTNMDDIIQYIEKQKVLDLEATQVGLEKLIEDHGGKNSCKDYSKYFYIRVDNGGFSHKRDLPWFALQAIRANALDKNHIPKALDDAWRLPEFPERTLGARAWVILWRQVGFTEDGIVKSLGGVPSVLYRGATTKYAKGMAWTDDLGRARWFASRFNPPGRVYQTEVSKGNILAHITSRGENEWIIDPKGIQMSLYREKEVGLN